MSPSDITVELLKQIRDGVYETHERIDQTNVRLDQTNARLAHTSQRLDQTRLELLEKIEETRSDLGERIDGTRSDLGERIDGTNARLRHLESSVSTLVGAVSVLADHDNRFESDLDALRRRVDGIEAQADR